MTRIPDERFEEIKAAEKAATPGPWVTRDEYVYRNGQTIAGCFGDNDEGDAEFIALARTAIPELLSEREEREGEIERLERQTETLHDNYRQRENELKAFNDRHRSFTEEAETRADALEKALEALREWALTARRLWGGGGGVHWKRFYAILDAGKDKK